MPRKANKEIFPVSFPVVGAIAAHRFCKLVEGGMSQCDTEGERVDGISGYAYADGYEMGVLYGLGSRTVEAGDAVGGAVEVMTDEDGRAIAHVPGGTNAVAGIVEPGSVALAAEDLIQVHHWPGGIVR